jgi:predicted DNA-binding transcriptional regulator AlpA
MPADPDSTVTAAAVPTLLTTRWPWDMVGISRASYYRLMSQGKAPRPLGIFEGRSIWRIADIVEWLGKLKLSTPTSNRRKVPAPKRPPRKG